MTLDSIQLRVLGVLIEKEIATPEYYPLSLNSIVAACNQKSSRDPVMELTESEVLSALDSLEDLALTSVVRSNRVPKYEHRVRTVLNLRRDETAILCLLLLRGAQTPGELRARADRLYAFDGIDAVESTLSRLMAAPVAEESEHRPLVTLLPKQPGSREARYMHLLGTTTEAPAAETRSDQASASEGDVEHDLTARVASLEAEVVSLRAIVKQLEALIRPVSTPNNVDGETSRS